MSQRKIKANSGVEPCPQCGNKTDFTIISQQEMEDCCYVWAVCPCGYEGDRFEDVWGGVDDVNCYYSMGCWNDKVLNEPNDKRSVAIGMP